ncbi:CHRD domain-containing protein [Streptomyces sp. NPDC047315]|uniref:CHRD domain-containing protein n=1 Tax=Streptomyces sp. NPDC047315 TaxID=3155142 RepID=UPI00340D80BD
MAPAFANGDEHSGHGTSASSDHGAGAGEATVFGKPAKGRSVSFVAKLSGANEVPVPRGPAVNDPDAAALAHVTVKGDRVTYSLQWKNVVPGLGHIHQGKSGQNGPVKVGLFGTAMPDSVHSAAGQVALTDAKLAQEIRTNPAGFYVNLHSAEFPGGAVRGQLFR